MGTHFSAFESKRRVATSFPDAPREGDFFYDTNRNAMFVYVVAGGVGATYTGWVFANFSTTTSTSTSTTTTSTSTTTTSTSSSTSSSSSTSTSSSTTTTL